MTAYIYIMERLYRIKNAKELSGDLEAYVVKIDENSFGIVNEKDDLVTFKHAKLENLLKFEDLTMNMLEEVRE